MRKWSFAFAAALVAVVGCSGGGGDDDNGSTGITGGSRDGLTINLPDVPGLIQVNYLTGQGRAPGDIVALVRQVSFQDEFGFAETQLQAERRLPLANYTSQIVNINVPFSGQNSRLFETFNLNFLRFEVEPDPGGVAQTFDTAYVRFPSQPLPLPFPARLRTFPGRQSIMPIFVDNSMFEVREALTTDADGNVVPANPPQQYLQLTPSANSTVTDEFGRPEVDPTNLLSSLFGVVNLPDVDEDATGEERILGFLSDYVAFDISGMPVDQRPAMLDGRPAQRVFFSGDGFAIGDQAGVAGDFESLTLDFREPNPGTFQDRPDSLNAPGTYNLLQTDPRDINQIARIVSLQGIFRDFTDVFSGMGASEAVTFPSSRDDAAQHIVFFAPSGNGVSRMYFGTADLEAGTFEAFPIANLVTGDIAGRVTGTLSNYRDRNGSSTRNEPSIRVGTYTFDGDSGGFPATGRFTVFRR